MKCGLVIIAVSPKGSGSSLGIISCLNSTWTITWFWFGQDLSSGLLERLWWKKMSIFHPRRACFLSFLMQSVHRDVVSGQHLYPCWPRGTCQWFSAEWFWSYYQHECLTVGWLILDLDLGCFWGFALGDPHSNHSRLFSDCWGAELKQRSENRAAWFLFVQRLLVAQDEVSWPRTGSSGKMKSVLNVVALISREVQGDLTIPFVENINQHAKNKLKK